MLKKNVDETTIDVGIGFIHFFVTPLLLDLFLVPLNCVETPFTTTSFLSLSLLFGLFKF